VTQAQVAGTLAALLGEDYAAEMPGAARPVGDAIRAGSGAASAGPLK